MRPQCQLIEGSGSANLPLSVSVGVIDLFHTCAGISMGADADALPEMDLPLFGGDSSMSIEGPSSGGMKSVKAAEGHGPDSESSHSS